MSDLPFIYQFLSGAVAGVSEILTMYPLDVVKTRIQLQTAAPGTPGAYNSMMDAFRKIIAQEGVRTLYKGITAPIMLEAPKRAVKFSANDSWGNFYKKLFGVDKIDQSLAVLTGATAGATEAFVVVPFELVKIRVQDVNTPFRGPGECLISIVKNEGPLALYNGLEATLWRHVSWNAGYFGVIFQVRNALPPPKNESEKIRNDLIAGTIGGTTGTVLNTPFDVVKSRIQSAARVPGVMAKYNWTLPALGTVATEEGFGALYKGFVPKVLRLGPGGGILLMVYTKCMEFFRTYAKPNGPLTQ